MKNNVIIIYTIILLIIAIFLVYFYLPVTEDDCKIEFISHTSYYDPNSNSLFVIGKMKNICDNNIATYLKLKFYNDTGDFIYFEDCYGKPKYLKPNEEGYFLFETNKNFSFSNYEIEFTGYITSSYDYTDYDLNITSIKNLSSLINGTFQEINGTITNKGKNTSANINIFCLLYDKNDNIIGYGQTNLGEDKNTYIKGEWVANNASLSWGWPPGPYNEKDSSVNNNEKNKTNIVEEYIPHIETWGEQTLATNINRMRFPSVTVAKNGDLVVIFTRGNIKDYSCQNQFWCMVSHDNGSTWDPAYQIHEFSFYTESWSLITAPNGDLLFLLTKDQEWDVHNGTDIWRNSFYGTEGKWYRSNNFSEFGKCFVYDWYTYDDKIYAFMNYPNIYDGAEARIVYSEDNGYSWSTMGNKMKGFGTGEWSALPLNENATHWKTINRFTSTLNFTSSDPSQCLGIPSHNQQYYPIHEQYETIDGGITWNNCSTNCPEACEISWMKTNQKNKGNKLWWLDDRTIVANVETIDDDACLYFNINNMSTLSWVNKTKLSDEHLIMRRDQYSRGCPLPKRENMIGGWGYVVWSEEGFSRFIKPEHSKNFSISINEPQMFNHNFSDIERYEFFIRTPFLEFV